MAYGVTDEGFVDKPLETILEEIEAEQLTNISSTLDVSATSPIGQLNAIFASHLREAWEVLQAVYSSFYPDTASGQSLANLAALTGTLKSSGTKSSVVGRMTVSAGSTIPAGVVASVDGNPSARFVSLVDVENTTGSEAEFDVTMEAEEVGATEAPAGDMTVIETPTAGLVSITNPANASLGEAEDTDATLRTRREEELRASGNGTLESIRAEIMQVSGVQSCTMYENLTDTTDGDGLPAYSFEAVVFGGSAADIGDAIWASKPAGVRSHGTTTQAVIDSEGNSHDVKFTVPEDVELYIEVDVTVDDDFPDDGDDLIEEALVDWATDNLGAGDDLILAKLYSVVFAACPGIVDVTRIEADVDASVLASNVTIGTREIGKVALARITVAVT